MAAEEFIPFSSWIICWTCLQELIVRNTSGVTSSLRNLAEGTWIIIDASKIFSTVDILLMQANMAAIWSDQFCHAYLSNSFELVIFILHFSLASSFVFLLTFSRQIEVNSFTVFPTLSLSWRRHSGILFFHYIFFLGLSASSFLVRNNRLNIFIQLCVLGN